MPSRSTDPKAEKSKTARSYGPQDIGMWVLVHERTTTHRGMIKVVNSDFVFVSVLDGFIVAAPHESVEPDPLMYGEQ